MAGRKIFIVPLFHYFVRVDEKFAKTICLQQIKILRPATIFSYTTSSAKKNVESILHLILLLKMKSKPT